MREKSDFVIRSDPWINIHPSHLPAKAFGALLIFSRRAPEFGASGRGMLFRLVPFADKVTWPEELLISRPLALYLLL